jgi:hypothetical protein
MHNLRENDLEKLKKKKDELHQNELTLEREKKEKTELANTKENEKQQLLVKLNQRKNILTAIKNDSKKRKNR